MAMTSEDARPRTTSGLALPAARRLAPITCVQRPLTTRATCSPRLIPTERRLPIPTAAKAGFPESAPVREIQPYLAQPRTQVPAEPAVSSRAPILAARPINTALPLLFFNEPPTLRSSARATRQR